MKKKLQLFNLFIVVTLFLGACNLPAGVSKENAAETAAAQTVQALLSATPVIQASSTPVPMPPTLTPIPIPVNTNTPVFTATSNCNVAQYVADVTIPDGTVMIPSQAFVKKWRIKNIGSCTWNGFSLVFDSGDAMGGPATQAIGTLTPGQEVDLSVNLTAPTSLGHYRGYWRVVTNSNIMVPMVGGYQGKSFYVDIKVQNDVTLTPSVTNTSPAPAFAVTSVSFTSTGACGGFTVGANITANGAGVVTYHFVRSDGATDTTTHPPIAFSSAGVLPSDSYTWNITTPGSYWIDIYIDSPNHQQFGRAAFTCP